MKNRKHIVLAGFAVALFALGIYGLVLRRPFAYEDKTLGEWLDKYTELYYIPYSTNWEARMYQMQSIDRKARRFGPAAVGPLIAEMQSRHVIPTRLHQLLAKHLWKYQWVRDLDHKCFIISMRPQTAAQFLYDLGPDAAPAIPALLAAAADTNQVLCANALNALGSIHQQPELVVPFLMGTLSNSWQATFAISSLGKFGTNAAAAVPALRALAENGNSRGQHSYALYALQKIAAGSNLDITMPIYLKILKDPQNPDRSSVILALMKLGPRAKEAVPLLMEIATNKNNEAQTAAYALKAIDPGAAADIWSKIPREPSIDQRLFDEAASHPGPETQEQFNARVRAMGDRSLAYLVKLVKGRPPSGNEVTEYEHAARALGAMGASARAAIPELTPATEDERWFVRVPAQAALIRIRGESLSPLIVSLKDTSDPIAWYETAMLLAEFSTNAEPAIPVVIEAMKDGDDIVQGHGALLLGAIHRQPEICLPVLTSLLDSPSVSSRQKALVALQEFGDDARPALPQITNALDDFDPWTQAFARRLVKHLETNSAAPADKK